VGRYARSAAVGYALTALACGRIGFDPFGAGGDGGRDDARTDSGSSSSVGIGSDPMTLDGTRLHARRWVTPDGAAAFVDWYDTQLDMHCQFAGTAGDSTRCLPIDASVFGYADPQCTQLAVAAAPNCAQPLYATGSATGYAVGAPIAEIYELVGSGSCTPASEPGSYFAAGSALPDDAFVAATRVTTTGATLGREDLVGSDGSREFVEVTDGAQYCTLAELDVDHAYCTSGVTEGVGFSTRTQFADAACTTRVLPFGTFSSLIHLQDDFDPCLAPRVFATASLADGTQLYTTGTTGCVPASTSNGATTLTDVTTTFPAATSQLVGAGRVRERLWLTPDGLALPGGLVDTELGVACEPQVTADGSAACAAVVEETGGQLVFSDMTCATAQFVTFGCAPAGTTIDYSQQGTPIAACVSGEPLASRTPFAHVYDSDSLGCFEATPIGGIAFDGSAGPPADLSQLVPMSLVIR
jgi:hypothetical protein